jgi:hypothetical protein
MISVQLFQDDITEKAVKTTSPAPYNTLTSTSGDGQIVLTTINPL